MRRKVRGLRTIEREVFAERRAAELARLPELPSEAPQADAGQADASAPDIVLVVGFVNPLQVVTTYAHVENMV